MGGESTEEVRLLSILADPSALSQGFTTLDLFSAAVGTGQTITGPTVNIKHSNSQTFYVDITGAAATGVVCTLRAGLSGLGFVTLRVHTGSGGSPGLYVWRNSSANNTGATQNSTGVTRIDDIFLQVANPASTTGGGAVTVRAKVLTSPF